MSRELLTALIELLTPATADDLIGALEALGALPATDADLDARECVPTGDRRALAVA